MSDQEFVDFEVDMDLTDAKAWDGEYQLVAPGDYAVRIVEFKQEPSSKGTPMIKVTFEVISDGDHKGQKLFGNYALTDKAKGRIKQLMVACGTSLDKIRASEFMGAELAVTVVHTVGDARIGTDGQPMEARTFANVQNERQLEQPAPAPAKAPPVTNTKAPASTKPAPQNSARRA